ncbi:MAG TPA: hypothetical protein P5548_03850 [Candidatus Moranbacteria bacterium]|nr:hypothetical protein [Candidatus Moranbacteria bacterium]
MSRHKFYQGRGTKAVIDADVEVLSEIDKDKKRAGKSSREFLESDRKVFVENAIEMNGIFEYRRKKFSDTEIVTRAKNILQSLVYLVLNDEFYDEVRKVRGRMAIPFSGFNSDKEYSSWLSGKDTKAIYREAEKLIYRHKLCYEKDVINLAPIIEKLISYKLNWDKFSSVVYPSVYEDALHCRVKGNASSRFVRGFDIEVNGIEDSQTSFFTSQWTLTIFPFTKLTGLGEMLRDFYEREFYSEKNPKDYNLEYLKLEMKKLNVRGNKDKIMKRQGLEVIAQDDFVKVTFTTNYFTKPSDIISLYKREKPRIQKSLTSREDRIRKIQKLHLTEKFERNYRIWELQKKGMTYGEISTSMYDEDNDLGDFYVDKIKGELGEFKANIRDSLNRRIVF